MKENQVKVKTEIDNLVSNVAIHLLDIIAKKVAELGLLEFSDEIDEIEGIRDQLHDIEKRISKKVYS